jgi:uncharacterized protein YdhG (YjbR/CyaY superfamily)
MTRPATDSAISTERILSASPRKVFASWGPKRCRGIYTRSRKEMRSPRSKSASSKSPRFKSIDDYLASVDPVKTKTLKSIIDFILKQFPQLESKISWNVPTLYLKGHRSGKYVAGICAYKHHLTFSAWSPRIIESFKPRLEEFVVMKNCFQIPVDWKIDEKLLKDLIRARLAELD